MLRRAMAGVLFSGLSLASVLHIFAQTAHAPDGGVMERLQSIDVSEKPGAPFRATVVTSWKRRLEDGTEVTIYNSRTIARDSTGRVFQERRFLTPAGNTQATPLSALEYYDPSRNEMTQCWPAQGRCITRSWRMNTGDAAQLPAATVSTTGVKITRESLGEQTIENLQVTGSREITTGPRLGYSEPTIKEFWYSPRLGLNLVVKRFEPRGGAENFSVTNIEQSEPDPRLFQPPQGYQVVQMPASPQPTVQGWVGTPPER